MNETERLRSSGSLAGTVLGRYRLESLLGEGGMGVVYAARHLDLGKSAAVKILNERYGDSTEFRARFLREGRAAARIRHPNIVDVYDVGVENGRPYLVMELLDGEDLRRFIAREGRLSAQRTADLMLPVISALAAAHDAGVIHRDLKPENVFLARERHALTPKVVDFGISKLIDAAMPRTVTRTSGFLGTPHYASPEQAENAKTISALSDQYSCGVLLYECVTGRRPVEEASLYRLIQRIVHGDFAPPRQFNSELPAAFEKLILKAMAKDPAQRFASMRAFGRALLDFASERMRTDYAEDFAANSAAAKPVAAGLPVAAQNLGSTLGSSIHERDVSPPISHGSRSWLPALGFAWLAAGLVSAAAWQLSRRAAPRPSPPFVARLVAATSLAELAKQIRVKVEEPPEPLTDLAGPRNAKGANLNQILGSKGDFWTIPKFAKLTVDMTPGECDQVIPGCGKVNEYDVAKVKANVKGVEAYEFSFQDVGSKKGLKFATILFDPWMTDEPFWNALVYHLKQRLPAEMTDFGGHHVLWISHSSIMWSLSEGSHDGYELQVEVDVAPRER